MTTSQSVLLVVITFAFLIGWIIVEIRLFSKKAEIAKYLNSAKASGQVIEDRKSTKSIKTVVIFLMIALLFSSCASNRMFPNASHYSNSGRGFVPPCRRF